MLLRVDAASLLPKGSFLFPTMVFRNLLPNRFRIQRQHSLLSRIRALVQHDRSFASRPRVRSDSFIGKAILATLSIDGFARNRKRRFSVIPAKAGIQYFETVANFLDPGFHRGDDFLRRHNPLIPEKDEHQAISCM
jgi:hypothetical protein